MAAAVGHAADGHAVLGQLAAQWRRLHLAEGPVAVAVMAGAAWQSSSCWLDWTFDTYAAAAVAVRPLVGHGQLGGLAAAVAAAAASSVDTWPAAVVA